MKKAKTDDWTATVPNSEWKHPSGAMVRRTKKGFAAFDRHGRRVSFSGLPFNLLSFDCAARTAIAGKLQIV